MSFYHALGARLGRFRNYVTAQPMQVTISSVLVFPVFFLFLYTVWNSWWDFKTAISASVILMTHRHSSNDKRTRRRNNHLGKVNLPVYIWRHGVKTIKYDRKKSDDGKRVLYEPSVTRQLQIIQTCRRLVNPFWRSVVQNGIPRERISAPSSSDRVYNTVQFPFDLYSAGKFVAVKIKF